MSDKIEVNEEVKAYLVEISKWTKLLGIVGYIGVGIMIVIAFFTSAFFSMIPVTDLEQMPIGFLSTVYFLLAGLYFFPVNYLFQFSKNLSQSLDGDDSSSFIAAFRNLKSHYKFMGLFVIVVFSMYASMFLVLLLL